MNLRSARIGVAILPLFACACTEPLAEMRLAIPGAVPCTSFADMYVWDTGDHSDGDDEILVAAAIAWFADQTGVEGVCVPGIEVVAALPDGRAGRYQGPKLPVQLVANQLMYGEWWTATHRELCRAFVDAEGVTAAELGEHFEDLDAFADACESGPPSLVPSEAVEEACGVALVEPWAHFMRDRVYAAYDESAAPVGVVEVTVGPLAIPIDGYLNAWATVAGGDTLYIVADRRDVDSARSLALLALDPVSGGVSASWHLADEGEYDSDSWSVVPGDTLPLVIEWSSGQAWRPGPDGRVPALLPPLPFDEGFEGVVLADVLYAWARVEETGPVGLVAIDLATGDAATIPLPTAYTEVTGGFGVDQDAVTFGVYGAGGVRAGAWYTPSTGAWRTVALPDWSTSYAAIAPGGRTVALWSVDARWGAGRADIPEWLYGLAVSDEDGDDWFVNAAPCDDTLLLASRPLVRTASALWLVTDLTGDDPDGISVARVTISPAP
ncbi:MAG: hypothetical protein Q8P18_02965 [Pseudomonadota bacterium]|nr:hypothetical protein [Pseudomonadota bacterium]